MHMYVSLWIASIGLDTLFLALTCANSFGEVIRHNYAGTLKSVCLLGGRPTYRAPVIHPITYQRSGTVLKGKPSHAARIPGRALCRYWPIDLNGTHADPRHWGFRV